MQTTPTHISIKQVRSDSWCSNFMTQWVSTWAPEAVIQNCSQNVSSCTFMLTHKTSFVVHGSPSTTRPSSLPWLCTETPLTWRRQSCQSWWCHRLDPPIPLGTGFRSACSGGRRHHPARTVPAFPLHSSLGKQEKFNFTRKMCWYTIRKINIWFERLFQR